MTIAGDGAQRWAMSALQACPDTRELQYLLELALSAARAGGEVALRYYGSAESWLKSDRSIVTRADIEAEEAITTTLLRADARAKILGEELGGVGDGISGRQWLVDPIDGTAWYALGLPVFGVLVALLVDREPVLGVIHFPALRSTISAGTGLGCWRTAEGAATVPARVSQCSTIGEATVSIAGLRGTELAGDQRLVRAQVGPLVSQCGALVTAGDCLQHSLVATGKLDIAVDPVMKPWDSAALIPCVREAGGAVGSLGTCAQPLAFAGSLVSAASHELLAVAIDAIRPPRC